MIQKKIKYLFLLFVLIALGGNSFTQEIKRVEAKPLSQKEIENTINKISSLMNKNYIFPDAAKKMGDYLKSQYNAGAYSTIDDPMKFSEQLTKDLQSISNDKHIRVRFSPEDAKRIAEQQKKGFDPDDEKHWNEMMRKENFGFRKVERLGGNIGYIDLRNFASPDYAKETIADAMGFVANTDALIFDMRFNGGGDPAGVQLICSYLFGDKPVHLNDLYYRPNDETKEYWTLKKVDGVKMPDVPVYVLTSGFTFSGAEEFSYNLKNLKRATLVGETTGGGAHPGGMMPVNDDFVVFIPTGRAINPITKTNWEGTGVTPDVFIKSELALEKAQMLALEKLSAGTTNEQLKNTYRWMIGSLEAVMNAPAIDEQKLKSYAGIYEDRTITYEGGKLYYQRRGRQKYQMTPMSEDTFMFKDIDYFRLKFVKDSDGKITEVNGLYDNGDVDKSVRSN